MTTLGIIANCFSIVGAVAVIVGTCFVVIKYRNAQQLQRPGWQLARLKVQIQMIMSENRQLDRDNLSEHLPQKFKSGGYIDLLHPAIVELKSEGFLRENIVTRDDKMVRQLEILNPVHDFSGPGAKGALFNDA